MACQNSITQCANFWIKAFLCQKTKDLRAINLCTAYFTSGRTEDFVSNLSPQSRMNAFTSPTGYPSRLLLCVTDEDNRGQRSSMLSSGAWVDDNGLLDPGSFHKGTVICSDGRSTSSPQLGQCWTWWWRKAHTHTHTHGCYRTRKVHVRLQQEVCTAFLLLLKQKPSDNLRAQTLNLKFTYAGCCWMKEVTDISTKRTL